MVLNSCQKNKAKPLNLVLNLCFIAVVPLMAYLKEVQLDGVALGTVLINTCKVCIPFPQEQVAFPPALFDVFLLFCSLQKFQTAVVKSGSKQVQSYERCLHDYSGIPWTISTTVFVYMVSRSLMHGFLSISDMLINVIQANPVQDSGFPCLTDK